MTNFEYWKDRILEIINKGTTVALESGNPKECFYTNCYNCGFCNNTRSCNKVRFEWFYSEHEEKPKLTKRERKLCEALETGWIAANKSGKVYWYNRLPIKGDNAYVNCGKSMYISGAGFQFDFIDFEDEEPWMVENLLQLEVEE